MIDGVKCLGHDYSFNRNSFECPFCMREHIAELQKENQRLKDAIKGIKKQVHGRSSVSRRMNQIRDRLREVSDE